MTVRLRDVADRAGVSVKTVSNVVHGYPHVRPETRERVQAALDELGYRPNLSARTLRRGRSGLIALALPALDIPYFAELAGVTVAAAATHGWTVLVDQTGGDPDREREVAAGLKGHLIDGLLLSPVGLGAEELERAASSVPMVLLGERITRGALDHVAVDNVAAARAATEHLLGLGRRRVAAIGYQEPERALSGVAPLRQAGYEEAIAARGMTVDAALAPTVASYGRTEGAEAMHRLLDLPEPPDAVFCFSDVLALGALRTLAVRRVRVPEEVAVVGFDDIEDGRFSTPSLTTVAPDKAGIATTALDLLRHRVEEPPHPARDVTVGFELVVRESTGGAPPA
ncbi:LacI family DNA-binding transcriptional regulator [Nocardioides caldifontis]|uniref:LacI family DNA-binding transcriptional regulator n=1 Tax=Nocardioides caldifontis TaxID=2588938 RepID=UPI0011E00AE6|nr:LacI family DNA-binding transcriptional regulator [Nocardioides caldifontis]